MANGRILEMLVQRNELRVSITKEFLSHVPKSGWGEKSLDDAVKFLGLKGTERLEAFPGGVPEITDFFGRWSDDRMLEALEDTYFEQLRIRDRIHACVKTRIQINANYKSSIRKLLSYLMIPVNTPLAMSMVWRMSSKMWYAAGDLSTDWNYYTKRALLSSVYSATVMFWLSEEANEQGDFPATWDFLSRRIEDVLLIFSIPKQFENFIFKKQTKDENSSDSAEK